MQPSRPDKRNRPMQASPAVRQVSEWFRQLEPLLNMVRRHGAEHPPATSAAERLAEDLAQLLEYHAPLNLRVTPTELWLMDERVITPPDPNDATADPVEQRVPYLLYRDGVRALSFDTATTPADVRALLGAVMHAASAPSSDDDTVTRLWRCDLTGLSLEIAPLEPLGAEPAEDATLRPRRAPDSVWKPANAPAGALEAWHALVATADADARTWRDAWRPERARRWPERVEELVHSALERPRHAELIAGLMAALASWLATAARRNAWAEATLAWECMREVDPDRQQCDAVLATALAGLDAEAIADRLDGADREEQGRFFSLMVRVGQPALEMIVRVMARSDRSSLRIAATTALAYACAEAPSALAPYLRDARWHVARNVVCALGQIGGEEAGEMLGSALRHPDPRVRRAAITSLGHVPVHRRTPLLVGQLDSPDAATRAAVLALLARDPDPRAVAALVERVSAPDFAARAETDRLGLLATLGDLGDDRGVNALEALLTAGGWFARRTPDREAAARALVALGTPHALDVVHANSHSRAEAVRTACIEALERREKTA